MFYPKDVQLCRARRHHYTTKGPLLERNRSIIVYSFRDLRPASKSLRQNTIRILKAFKFQFNISSVCTVTWQRSFIAATTSAVDLNSSLAAAWAYLGAGWVRFLQLLRVLPLATQRQPWHYPYLSQPSGCKSLSASSMLPLAQSVNSL